MKNICFIFIIAILAIVIILLAFSMKCQENDFEKIASPKSEMSLDYFLQVAKEHGIVYTEIYYMPFSISTTDFNVTEEALLSGPYLKVISGHFLSSYPSYIASALGGLVGQKQKNIPLNIRYICIMYSEPKKAIRFSITLSSPDTIFINGNPYESTPELIDAFLKLLPARDYEDAIKYIQKTGAAKKFVK
jgi:hypothetical protein